MDKSIRKFNRIKLGSILFINVIIILVLSIGLIYFNVGIKDDVLIIPLTAIAALFFARFYNKTYLIIFLLLFLVPLHGFLVRLGLPGILAYWKEILLMVGTLIVILKMSSSISFHKLDILIIIFIIYTLARAILSNNIVLSFTGVAFYTFYTLLYFLVTNTIKDDKQITRSLDIVIASALVIGIGGIFQSLFNFEFLMTGMIEAERFGLTRASFSVGSSIVFGAYMAIASSIQISRIILDKKRKLINLVILIVLLVATILSFTRIAWIQIIITLMVQLIILFKLRPYKTKSFIILIVFFSVLIIALLFFGSGYFSFFNGGFVGRVDSWLKGISIANNNLFFGQGPGTTIWAINSKLFNDVFVTESYIIQILAELGIVGLLFYLNIVLYSIRIVFKSIRKTPMAKKERIIYKLFAISALVGLLFNMFLAQSMNAWVVSMMFWFTIALARINIQEVVSNES